MKLLIINIDRDNDFGRKAKIKSPIIGIKDNEEAAFKLGRADPEDSDVNAIFLAISLYDKLHNEGKEVEIVTLCGDISVGIVSDQKIADQLDTVIKQTGADEAILITDGAEDEYVLPIVQSRIKIRSIQRVSVKQSEQLEDTYYRVIKMLDDEKVKKQFILPLTLILLVGATFILLNMAASGFGAILFTLGVYLLIRVFNLERTITKALHEVKSGILTGKLSFYTYLVSLVILVIGGVYSYNKTDFNPELLWAIPVLSFLLNMTWPIVFAGLVATSGRFTDMYVHEKKVHWSSWIIPFSLFAFGFIASAIFESLYISLLNNFSIAPFSTWSFIGFITVGVLIAFIGMVSYHYIKEMYGVEEQEKEIEEQLSSLADTSK